MGFFSGFLGKSALDHARTDTGVDSVIKADNHSKTCHKIVFLNYFNPSEANLMLLICNIQIKSGLCALQFCLLQDCQGKRGTAMHQNILHIWIRSWQRSHKVSRTLSRVPWGPSERPPPVTVVLCRCCLQHLQQGRDKNQTKAILHNAGISRD